MIKVVRADITTLHIDAIVNAANRTLQGGGGVDGAIHRAAGPELLAACRNLRGCPVGEARITPGFKLRAKWVIHTVGPIWQGGHANEAKLLASCYYCCAELAIRQAVNAIAFPGISTGAYGYPKEPAATIAVSAMQAYQGKFEQIIFCCFSDADKKIYEKILNV